MALTSTPSNHDSCLIDSGVSYHMAPHREWLCKYEKCGGGDVLLGNDSLTKIIGWGKVRLILKYGRKGTHTSVLHIPGLARNLICVNKMGDARVHTTFEKDSCKML